MRLMRIGPAGGERPVVRLDDSTYVALEANPHNLHYLQRKRERLGHLL